MNYPKSSARSPISRTVIDLRPIYHRTDDRVVAALAFLLHRAIEKKLKAGGLEPSATEALTALKSVPSKLISGTTPANAR